MSKRQLSRRYKDLVDYIENENKSLAGFLTEAIKEGRKFPDRDNKLWRILEDLYTIPLLDSEFGELIKTIVDIYNDNYELEEPKYYWKFKEPERVNKYAVYFGLIDGELPVIFDVTQKGRAKKCTKSELNDYWHYTNLTADNFTPVEEIEND